MWKSSGKRDIAIDGASHRLNSRINNTVPRSATLPAITIMCGQMATAKAPTNDAENSNPVWRIAEPNVLTPFDIDSYSTTINGGMTAK
ncbi:hypothetical protein GCM10025859_46830 [Alicyclobacillus fastidiosus]|nr:hypothetical protein GCM10025859_46830 [Alicyclobacillus fastidiosus]